MSNLENTQSRSSLPLDQQPLESEEPHRVEEKEMSFVDHLEELRWHLIRGFAAIAIFSVVAFLLPEVFFKKIILGPSTLEFITYQQLCQLSEVLGSQVLCIQKLGFTIINRSMTGQFSMHILYSFIIGFIIAFPYVFWEIWRFVKPGLYANEQKLSTGATVSVSTLFLIGVSFGYFIVSPLAVNFLGNYQIDTMITNQIDLTSYVSTVATIVMSAGVMFQLPIVVYFLSRVGVLTPAVMRHFRKHSIVVILIISAIITPPDPITQIFISVPIFILYEMSIMISARVQKRLEKEQLAFENSSLQS